MLSGLLKKIEGKISIIPLLFITVYLTLIVFVLLSLINNDNSAASLPSIVSSLDKEYVSDIDKSVDELANIYQHFLTEQEIIFNYQFHLQKTQLDYLKIKIHILNIRIGIQHMIDDGAAYDTVSSDIKLLKQLLKPLYESDSFLDLPPETIKKIRRIDKAFSTVFKDIKRLDDENVSMTQLMELHEEAHNISDELNLTMQGALEYLDLQVRNQIEASQKESTSKLDQIDDSKNKIYLGIANSRREISQNIKKMRAIADNMSSRKFPPRLVTVGLLVFLLAAPVILILLPQKTQ